MKGSRLLRGLLLTFGGLLLVVLCLGFATLEFPRLIFNPKVIGFGAQLAPRFSHGLSVHWSGMATDSQSLAFADKRVHLHFDGLCIDSQNQLHACFSAVDLSFRYDFGSLRPTLKEIGPVNVLGGDAKLVLLTASTQPAHQARATLPDAKLMPVRIDLARFDIKEAPVENKPSPEFVGSLEIASQGPDLRIELQAKQRGTRDQVLATASADITGQNPSGMFYGPWSAQGAANVDLMELGQGRFKLKLDGRSRDQYLYRVDGNVDTHELTALLGTDGSWEKGQIKGSLEETTHLKKPVATLSRAGLHDCRYQYGKPGKFTLRCPAFIELPKLVSRRGRAAWKALGAADRLVVDIDADLHTPYPTDFKQAFAGVLTAQPRSFLGKDIRTRGGLRAEISMIPAQLPAIQKFDGSLDFSTRAPDFQKLVRALAHTAAAIPAPLDVLAGDGVLSVQGKLNLKGGTLATRFATRLASPQQTQRLSLEGNGNIELALNGAPAAPTPSALDGRFDLLLKNVRLSLPELSISMPPQFFPDARLSGKPTAATSKKARATSPMKVTYQVTVKTPPDHPLQLASGFTGKPVPIHVDLALSQPTRLKGSLRVEQFRLDTLGLQKDVGQILVRLDVRDLKNARNRADLIGGSVTVLSHETSTAVPPAQLAGQAAGEAAETRTEPEFNVPVVKLLTSILFGTPLQELAIEPNTQARPAQGAEETHDPSGFISLRRRPS